MGSEGFFHRPSSSTFLLLVAFCASQLFSFEEIQFSGVRNAPFFGTDMRHLVASQLPSLQFWLVSKIVRAVLTFHQKVSLNSQVTNRLQVKVPVTLLLFRPSESPFASLSSLIGVGSDISSSRSFSSSSSLAVHDESVTVRLIGVRLSMKPCCVWASVARGEEPLVCV